MKPRKTKRLKTVSAHFLLLLHYSKKIRCVVKSTSKYPQATCTGRHKKVRMFCA